MTSGLGVGGGMSLQNVLVGETGGSGLEVTIPACPGMFVVELLCKGQTTMALDTKTPGLKYRRKSVKKSH